MQNTYGLFPIIMSNDPCKNKFNHASAKSVPTFGRACFLYGELRVKWTCVIFADFGHGDFLSQNELPKIIFFTAVCLSRVTPTQYVVNSTLYWPHTALSVYLVCYFLVPHTHVLCMGSGSATGKKIQVRLVLSLLKYFFKFQLWYWIKNLHYQIFKFVIDNSDISLNCLQHIQKRRNFDAKVTCHQPICLLLHAILSGVGVIKSVRTSSWIFVLSFARAKNILCACPTVGSVRG